MRRSLVALLVLASSVAVMAETPANDSADKKTDTKVGASAQFAAQRPAQSGPQIPAQGSAQTSSKSAGKIDKQTRMELMRIFNAEFAFARMPLPLGDHGAEIKPDGKVQPAGSDLRMLLANAGVCARPGERVQITNVSFTDKDVIIEINGGAKKKSKWYQRIQVAGNNGSAPIAPGPDHSRARGTTVKVEFDQYVPEMTATDLKQRLAPVLDFTVKSAAEAFADAMPPNVRKAIQEHRVLVGMNKTMVEYAKGRPPKRVREKAGEVETEEWIYGEPPEDVDFIRFKGDEVSQVKIMKVGGEKIVRTEREVQPFDAITGQPVAVAAEEQKPEETKSATAHHAPTLRRPGEAPPEERDPAAGPKPLPPLSDPNAQMPGSGPEVPGVPKGL